MVLAFIEVNIEISFEESLKLFQRLIAQIWDEIKVCYKYLAIRLLVSCCKKVLIIDESESPKKRQPLDKGFDFYHLKGYLFVCLDVTL